MKCLVNESKWSYDGKPFSIENPLAFHQSVSIYEPTPLYDLKGLAAELSLGKILVKNESHRFGIKAFKGLGAFYAISRLVRSREVEGVITATDGNHGRAVAWAAKKFGLKAKIFMPKGSANARVEAIKAEGAEVVVTNHNYDQTVEMAKKETERMNWSLVQDTAWKEYVEIPHWIMEGYLTQMVEVYEQLKSMGQDWPEYVVLQSGVGSWAASVVWFLKEYLKLNAKVILVEPMEAAGALESMKTGRRVVPEGNFNTVMAGLNCGIPSFLAWPILQKGVDMFIAMDDSGVKEAMRLYYYPRVNDPKVISGETGCAGLAGLMALLRSAACKETMGLDANSRVLLFNTEGDTDPSVFQKMVGK